MPTTRARLLLIVLAVIFMTGFFYNKPRPFNTATLTAKGYGGPITLELAVSEQNVIRHLKVLRHHETTSYVKELDKFLAQFTGRSTRDPLILGQDIDAISGATITSAGITRAVHQALQQTPATDTPLFHPLGTLLICAGLWSAAIAAFLLRHNAGRWAVMSGGFVYFGLMTHTMLSLIQVVQAGLWHMPALDTNPLWWFLLLFTLLSTLVVGRIYCGSLCPFALVQETLHFFTRHQYPLRQHITPRLDAGARRIKYALLFLIIIVCAVTGHAAAAEIEPFITLFAGHGSKPAFALLVLMLILSMFNFRFWCKYLCPVGALTSLIAGISRARIQASDRCTACGACVTICPTQAIKAQAPQRPVIDNMECIACGKCLRLCPEQALTFSGGCHAQR